jgi:hypothetical protein
MFEKDSDLWTDRYRIVVKNPIQFRLIIGVISGGASFRMACRFLLLTKEETGLSSIGNISVSKVTSFIRFTCDINLQKISEMLASSWTFSLAMDTSKHLSTSYLDISHSSIHWWRHPKPASACHSHFLQSHCRTDIRACEKGIGRHMPAVARSYSVNRDRW